MKALQYTLTGLFWTSLVLATSGAVSFAVAFSVLVMTEHEAVLTMSGAEQWWLGGSLLVLLGGAIIAWLTYVAESEVQLRLTIYCRS